MHMHTNACGHLGGGTREPLPWYNCIAIPSTDEGTGTGTGTRRYWGFDITCATLLPQARTPLCKSVTLDSNQNLRIGI